MLTKLIELQDGTLVEVETRIDEVQQISGGFFEKVSSSLSNIKPLLTKICEPITQGWEELNQKAEIEQIEVEVGISYEAEGNLYITKLKSGANMSVKLILKPKTQTK